MQRMEKQPRPRSFALRIAALVLMVGMLAGLFSQSVFAQNSYVITDGDNVTVHQSYSTDPDVVLDEVGIELSDEDTYTTSYNDGVSRIDIQRMQLVTVDYRGNRHVAGTYGETVGQLLDEMGLEITERDHLSCERDQLTYDGLLVQIIHTEVKSEQNETVIPFETNYFEDPELEPGEEIVLVEGSEGLVCRSQRVVYENGVEISRETLGERTVTEAVTRLVIRGPETVLRSQPDEPEYLASVAEDGNRKQSVSTSGNTLTTDSGMTYTYSKKVSVTCTAYSCEGYTGITATGTIARVGAVAVDPKYIPLGTKMYIVSNDGKYVYGYCVAEDTGGSIKGMKIDLYFDTVDECWDFGVRSCTAYILKD
ncbi:MAG: G5 domain-containing protein [Oscillospiraceae bacterium]|nr:G5 domain-containing protein [Oscillospiraceae bacterium]